MSSSPATEAPFSSADRQTRSGSMMPISNMSPYRPSSASNPSCRPICADLGDHVVPGYPALAAMRYVGSVSERRTISTPTA